ncbi:type VII secretion protein EccE [Streptomyces nigra]|uniref:type VII secretion protein EccE n=1 Tax=Streptomyces nigra TaxID=1827580 RepID=UPI00371E0D86
MSPSNIRAFPSCGSICVRCLRPTPRRDAQRDRGPGGVPAEAVRATAAQQVLSRLESATVAARCIDHT